MNAKRILLILSIVSWMVVFNASLAVAQGKGKKGNGKGGDLPEYNLVDLLGFDNGELGLQSRARFILDRNGSDETQIYGESYHRIQEQPPSLTPAIWHIDTNGDFPFHHPIDRGLPSASDELEPTGFNDLGIGVCRNRRANQKDEFGNWIFPGFVDVPGVGYIELPGTFNRDTTPHAINNGGVIVGTYDDFADDPNDPDGRRFASGMWQLQPDWSITGPVDLGNFYPDDVNNHGVMAGTVNGHMAIAWFDTNNQLQILKNEISDRFLGPFVEDLSDFPIADPRLTIVGTSWLDENGEYNQPDSRRAIAWRPFDASNTTTVIGTLGGNDSRASSVNDHGQIVGWSDTKRNGPRAFIYENDQLRNLNDLTATGKAELRYAAGINNQGDIVGWMKIPRPVSEQRGFLLRPIE